jgi:hypothetical protein
MFPYESLEVYKKAFRLNQELHKMIKSKNLCFLYQKPARPGFIYFIRLNIQNFIVTQQTKKANIP